MILILITLGIAIYCVNRSYKKQIEILNKDFIEEEKRMDKLERKILDDIKNKQERH